MRSAAARASSAAGRLAFPGLQPDLRDPAAALGDARLPGDQAAVFEDRFEHHIRRRGRIDGSRDAKDLRGDFDGFMEVAGDASQRGQEQIAEAVSLEAASALKAVLEEPGHQGLVFRKCHHAVADVTRRKDLEIATQPPGAAAIVGDGHDRGYVDDRRQRTVTGLGRGPRVPLESIEEGGESGASADAHNPERFSGVGHRGAAWREGRQRPNRDRAAG